MKQKFVDFNFRKPTLEIIDQANTIVAQYQGQGFQLTLRQLYYQFVSRDIIPNTEDSYKKLGKTISDGRLAGMIDWNAIEDRTRNVHGFSSWEKPEDIISSALYSYKTDLWKNQPVHLEVWVEKDALSGVVETACSPLRVPSFACRGYVSQSEMYDAAMRFVRHTENEKEVHILYLGDHDPSGIDMTRDVRDRISLFSGGNFNITVTRLGLNYDQVEQYNPPPNPAKSSDARFSYYQQEYGDESWELDALEPQVLVELISENIRKLYDPVQWSIDYEKEETERHQLKVVYKNYENIIDTLEERGLL